MEQVIKKLNQEKKIKWPDSFKIIANELNIVEENLTTKLPAKSKLLKEIISYIFLAGGKRLRPALSFLFAKATGEINEKHIVLSELTELIHTASLIHDDIIDSAKLRRGRETINFLWNDKISVISGDFLFAQASVRLGILENSEIVKIYANVLSELCDGEIEQYSLLFNTNITWDDYIQKSTSKTASLFSACCKSAAILNSAEKNIINQAKDFGLFLGIAFQIVDDILDFTSSSDNLGKEVCSDLQRGIITAPTLYALKSTDERAKQIRTLIENRFNETEADLDKVIRLIFELGGCDKAKELAASYINKALESISFIHNHEVKSALIEITKMVIKKI